MTQGVAGYPSGVSAETNQGCPGLIKSVRNKSLLSCLCVTQKTSLYRGVDDSFPRRQVHNRLFRIAFESRGRATDDKSVPLLSVDSQNRPCG